jgi:serine phosphatase RsbU (regulator of sigma subunit)
MRIFDQRPLLFRSLIALLLAVQAFFIAITIYNYASSPTDENVFRDQPYRLYITKTIAATLEKEVTLNGTTFAPGRVDSIRPGDFLLGLEGRTFGGQNLYDDAVAAFSVPNATEFAVEIFRSSFNQKVFYRLQKRSMPQNFFREMGSYAYVSDVTPDGASDRAGMKLGDLIVRINGKSFKNANEADAILRSGQTGKNLIYEIIRDDKEIHMPVTLAKFGIPFSLLLLTVAGLTYLTLGGFIALKRPSIRAARLTGLWMMMIGYAIAVIAVRRELDQSGFLFARNLMMVLSIYLSIATAFHAGSYFPVERPELINRRWIHRSYYIAAVLGFVLLLLIKTNGLYGLVIVAGVGIVIAVVYRKQVSPEYKLLNRVIKWAGISMAVLIVGGIGGLLAVSGQLSPGFLGYLGTALLIVPLAHLYTIGRYRLLDMNLRLRRNIQYTLVTAVWTMAVVILGLRLFTELPRATLPLPNVVITGSSIEITDSPSSVERREQVQRIGFMLVGLTVAYGFWRVRGAGQGVIDRKFFRAHYDYRKASTELAEVLATKLNMQELARGIVEKISAMMQLKRAGVLFFRNQRACCCHEAQGFDGEEWKTFCVSEGSKIGEAVERFQGEFRVDYLPAGVKELFQQQHIQYLVPVRSKNELIGVLLIGEKMAESTFHQEDFAFLKAAAKQASLSIENAFLYEELAEKERLKHELAIARRIQLESLPQSVPNVPGLDIAGVSLPAMEVGGDFFDYLDGSPDKLTVIVGDVSGKGTSAALYMSKVQGILRSLHGFGLSPSDLFIRANKLLCKDLEKRSFVTVSGAEFDSVRRTVDFSRAGHLPLLYFKADRGRIERLVPKGLGLGLNDKELFTNEMIQTRMNYSNGDVLLFVTDGITEAHNGVADQFGEDRLERSLLANARRSATEIIDSILEEVKTFTGAAPQHDDQTIVVVKVV